MLAVWHAVSEFRLLKLLGVVSSVAGLIGLSGQILEGCLFAKSFFDDAKHSPKDVQSILKELEIVRTIAEKTRVLFGQAHNLQAAVNLLCQASFGYNDQRRYSSQFTLLFE